LIADRTIHTINAGHHKGIYHHKNACRYLNLGPKTAFKKRGYKRGPGDNPGYNIGISFLCHLFIIQSVSFPYEPSAGDIYSFAAVIITFP
jgi:hypothetical protein